MNQMNASPNPYALLHLREGAPRDLVDETYWLLVRRLKYGVIEDVEGLRELDRLNAAYELIVRNGVRQETVATGAKGERARRWSRRKSRAPIVRDPYETLFVSEDADPDIASLAAKVLAGRPPSDLDGREWNDAVSEAAANVSARWQAAQANGAHPTDDAGETAAASDVGGDDLVAQPTAVEVEDDAASPAQADERLPVHHVADATDAEADQPPQLDVDPLDALAASVMPQEVASPIARVGALEVETAVAHVAPVEVARDDAPETAASDDSGATPNAASGRGWFDRLRGRSEERAAMAEAENERLLTLSADDDASRRDQVAHHNGHKAHDERPTTHPALRIVPQGPVTLELTPDEGYDFLLGDPADPARIQIWRQGHRYLLQQVSGPVASVGGEALVSPIVVLEDGDEVACGDDVVRISFGEAPATSATGPDVASSNA